VLGNHCTNNPIEMMVIHVGVAHTFVNDEFPIDTRKHEACAEALEI